MKSCSFFILLILTLTSCAVTKAPAPIEYNHKNAKLSSSTIPTIDNDGAVVSSSTQAESLSSEVISPYKDGDDYIVPAASPIEQGKKIIYHEVRVGETIEDIALKYEQTVDEITMLNQLYPPYYLDEFQIIKIKVNKDAVPAATPQQQIIAPTPQALDFVAPVPGKVISKFGEKTAFGQNKGINIEAKAGTKVIAAAGGQVIYADYDATFGYLVIIKVAGKNIVTSYAHLEDMVLSKGASIKQGDIVGYVGNTGKVKTAQLHFGIRDGKTAKDPLQYVNY